MEGKASTCLRRFVCGGAPGADMGPISVYRELGMELTGFMPRNFARDDGGGRELAEEHGLMEGEGGFAWRDKANAKLADAIVGFLLSIPKTGKGTRKTVSLFTQNEYSFTEFQKPPDAHYLIVPPRKGRTRPAMLIWDITPERGIELAPVLRQFVTKYKVKALMVSGSMEKTYPGMEEACRTLLCASFEDREEKHSEK